MTRPLAAAVSGRGVVDPDDAVVACDDEGFARGRAAFETLRVYDGAPFRLAEHVDRLVQSAARIGLPAPDAAEVSDLARLALAAVGSRDGDAALRLYWTPGPPGGEATAVALVSPVPEWIEPARRARPAARLARVPRAFGTVAPARHEVRELRDQRRRRGGGKAAWR